MTEKRIQKFLQQLKHDKDIVAVMLFGSYARGDNSPDSDIDICLVLDNNLEKSALSSKRLQYSSNNNMDVQIFQALPIYIRTRVIKEGKILFVANEELLYEIAMKNIQEYEDYKPFYFDYLDQVANG